MTTREYKILGAASARSTIDELTVWALSRHSLRFDLMSDLGRNRAIGNFIHRTETTTRAKPIQVVPNAVQFFAYQQ